MKSTLNFTDKGELVEVIETFWNDSFTKKLIGKRGQITSFDPEFGFIEVEINQKSFPFHFTELKKVKQDESNTNISA